MRFLFSHFEQRRFPDINSREIESIGFNRKTDSIYTHPMVAIFILRDGSTQVERGPKEEKQCSDKYSPFGFNF